MRQIDLGLVLGEVESAGPLDGVFLMTGGGEVLAGWSRRGLREDVLTVMSATMTGSVDVLLEELRGRRPRQILVEADDRRLMVVRTREDALLVLLAPKNLSRLRLTAVAQELIRRLADLPERQGEERQTVSDRS